MSYVQTCGIVLRRQLRMNVRNPVWLIIGLSQPVLYLILFGPLLKPLAGQLGYANAYAFFVPGLLVQLGIFGAFFAGFALVAEWKEGVIEGEQVTPAPRSALLAGRVARDVVLSLVQSTVLVALGYAMGLDAPLLGVAAGIGLTLLIGVACASAANALAMTTKSEDSLAPIINGGVFPVILLSGILLPMGLGPDWLRRLSDFVPTRYVVDAVRHAFHGDLTWADLGLGAGWALALAFAGLAWGTWTFRRHA